MFYSYYDIDPDAAYYFDKGTLPTIAARRTSEVGLTAATRMCQLH